jgi:hypothetical protein
MRKYVTHRHLMGPGRTQWPAKERAMVRGRMGFCAVEVKDHWGHELVKKHGAEISGFKSPFPLR